MICFDKSISDRKGRSRLFPRLFLLGFLLYGLNAAAQEPDSVLSAKASKSTRQKTSVLASEKQDTVVFRFAPKRRMFWADYKGNAAAINSLTQSIRQHKLSIESGDMKVRMLGFCSSYDSFKTNLAAAKNRSNQVKSYFIVHEGLKEEHFRTTNSTQRWRGMTDVIAVAYVFRSAGSNQMPEPESDVMPVDSLSGSEAEPTSEKPVIESACNPVSEIPAEISAEPESESTQSVVEALEGMMFDPYVLFIAGPLKPMWHIWPLRSPTSAWSTVSATTTRSICRSSTAPTPWHATTACVFWLFSRIPLLAESPDEGSFLRSASQHRRFQYRCGQQKSLPVARRFYGVGLSYGYVLPFARHWAAEFTVARDTSIRNTILIIIYQTAPASKRDGLTTTGA